MFEQRVGKLEEKVDRIEVILTRLEPKIAEVLQTCAKQSDLHKLQLDVVELKATSAKQTDLTKVQADIAEMKGRLSGIEGRIGSVEGRFNQIPTIWHLFVFNVTLLVGMAGLIYTAGKSLHP